MTYVVIPAQFNIVFQGGEIGISIQYICPIEIDDCLRDNQIAPINRKTGETRRRKVMGLKSRKKRDDDCQTAEKSKTAKRRRRKARRLKPAGMLIMTDRLTERQNQGNLMTQSHGSKVTTAIVTRIARLPKSKSQG